MFSRFFIEKRILLIRRAGKGPQYTMTLNDVYFVLIEEMAASLSLHTSLHDTWPVHNQNWGRVTSSLRKGFGGVRTFLPHFRHRRTVFG